MAYTDFRHFIAEFSKVFEGGNVVLIEKSGGGTIGSYYRGEDWRYMVLLPDGGSVYVCAKGTITIGKSASHEMAADEVYSYYELGDI